MKQMQTVVQKHFHLILMLLIASGFLMLLAELLLTGHTKGIQLVGVAASLLGTLLAAVGIVAKGKLRYGLVMLFLLLSISGIAGVVKHYEYGAGRETTALPSLAMQATVQTVSDPFDEGESEGTPPPLAPLSLAGFALMGAVTLFARKDE